MWVVDHPILASMLVIGAMLIGKGVGTMIEVIVQSKKGASLTDRQKAALAVSPRIMSPFGCVLLVVAAWQLAVAHVDGWSLLLPVAVPLAFGVIFGRKSANVIICRLV